jgi:hypothetical protein
MNRIVRTSDHDHARMLTRKRGLPSGTTEMIEASSNDTASPARSSGGARNSWPDAIRYPAATAVDPGERN